MKTITVLSLTSTLAFALGTCAVLPAALASPAAKTGKAGTTPAGVQGRWIATSISATHYEDDNGRYLGNGSGTAQIYDFDAHGHYQYYMMMEVRTGTFVSQARNSCQGRVTFSGDTLSLRPTSGHYHFESGGHVTDRPMNAADLGRVTKTYHWRTEKGADGKPRFIIPFSDGSKMEFRPSKG